jgi:hypothetical protein
VIDFVRPSGDVCLWHSADIAMRSVDIRFGIVAVRLSLPQLSRQRPDHAEELSRIVSTIRRGDNTGGCEMTAECVAATVLILLIVWGVTGILTQDKFRL